MFDILQKQTHILIAGSSGSGKSVLLNDIILWLKGHQQNRFIYIDLKMVELVDYRHQKDCIAYADSIESALQALQRAMQLIEHRYKQMQRLHQKKYSGIPVYIVVDELADLMTVARKQVQPLIQRISQIGRAAGVHLVVCTQCPLSKVIPTEIKVNFDCVIGLHTRSKQDSRNIIGQPGLETLPLYGYGLLTCPQLKDPQLYRIPVWK